MVNNSEKVLHRLEEEIRLCERAFESLDKQISDASWRWQHALQEYEIAVTARNGDAMRRLGAGIEVEQNEISRFRKERDALKERLADLRKRHSDARSELLREELSKSFDRLSNEDQLALIHKLRSKLRIDQPKS